MTKTRHILGISLLLLAARFVHAAPENFCGELVEPAQSGPWDYRLRAGENLQPLRLVESAHFTSEVEQGIRGKSTYLGGDLHYTLAHFPNHHRALAALGRIAIRTHAVQLQGATYPVECYYERAIRWAPDDPAVYSLYGTYLSALNRNDDALHMFERAVNLLPEDPTYNYNLGLSLFKAKRYEEANVHAHKAYAQDFPLAGLKNMLTGVGKWQDVPDLPAQQPAQAALPPGADEQKTGNKQQ